MMDEKSQTGTGEGKRYLRLSGATEEDVDAFIDALLDEAAMLEKTGLTWKLSSGRP
jgi:hypothetical protein